MRAVLLVSRGAHVAFSANRRNRPLEDIEAVRRSTVRAYFILQWRHLVREAQGMLRNVFEGSDLSSFANVTSFNVTFSDSATSAQPQETRGDHSRQIWRLSSLTRPEHALPIDGRVRVTHLKHDSSTPGACSCTRPTRPRRVAQPDSVGRCCWLIRAKSSPGYYPQTSQIFAYGPQRLRKHSEKTSLHSHPQTVCGLVCGSINASNQALPEPLFKHNCARVVCLVLGPAPTGRVIRACGRLSRGPRRGAPPLRRGAWKSPRNGE